MFFSVLSLVLAIPSVSGGTMTVGPAGDFITIQSAVENATAGDVIQVEEGTYRERLSIDVAVTVEGDAGMGTRIEGDGEGDVVTVNASGVKLSHLVVRGSGRERYDAGVKLVNASNCTLTHLDVSEVNGSGIVLSDGCNDSVVQLNYCKSNGRKGIWLFDLCHWNRVDQNECFGNQESGVHLSSGCDNNSISYNLLSGNGVAGVRLHGSCRYNTLSDNMCIRNSGHGIELRNWCRGNVIRRSRSDSNKGNGIHIQYVSSGNLVENNRCHLNEAHGILCGDQSAGNLMANNSCSENGETGIFLAVGSGCRVVNNTCDRNRYGIQTPWSSVGSRIERNKCSNNSMNGIMHCTWSEHDGSVIIENECHDNGIGILVEAGRVTVRNNTCTHNGRGIVADFGYVTFLYNNCHHNEGAGISGDKRNCVYRWNDCSRNGQGLSVGSGYNLVEENTCKDNVGTGIGLYSPDGSNLWERRTVCVNNTCSGNVNGIVLSNAHSFTVADNDCSGNLADGIRVRKSIGCSVNNNSVTENGGSGVSVSMGVDGTDIEDNSCGGNGLRGIIVFDNDGRITVEGNLVTGSGTGILLLDVGNATIIRNRFVSNGVGIEVSDSRHSIVLDNWFENDRNHNVSSVTNLTWNASRTPGCNIMGGRFLGGNYWSDYTGEDLDGDDLGDTDLPYGPGDHLPLIRDLVPPGLKDVTAGQPTTGDVFSFAASIDENWRVDRAWVEYSYGDGPTRSEAMAHDGSQAWVLTVVVPHHYIGPMSYRLFARDLSLNLNSTAAVVLTVVDNDLPTIQPAESANVTGTGNPLDIVANVTDNVALEGVWVEFWFGDGDPSNESLENFRDDAWSTTIWMPDDSLDDLRYRLVARDSSGNTNASEAWTVAIVDDDPPRLVDSDCPGSAVAGLPYGFQVSFEDNFGVFRVWVEHWYGVGERAVLDLERGPGILWSAQITLNASLVNWTYVILAEDIYGNRAILPPKEFWLEDATRPSFLEDGAEEMAYTGDPFVFQVVVVDDIGVEGVSVEWQFGEGAWNGSPMEREDGSGWGLTITVPTDVVEVMRYRYHARDSVGNENTTEPVEVDVLDNDAPTFGTDYTHQQQTTSEELLISIDAFDNVAILRIRSVITLPDGGVEEMPMTSVGMGEWNLRTEYTMPGNYTYVVRAEDVSGNENETGERRVTVHDTTLPSFSVPRLTPETPVTGDTVELEVEVVDNGEVVGVWLVLTSPGGNVETLRLEPAGDSSWKVTFTTRETGSHWFRLKANDAWGNEASSESFDFGVEEPPDEGPSLTVLLAIPILLIIIVGVSSIVVWRTRT